MKCQYTWVVKGRVRFCERPATVDMRPDLTAIYCTKHAAARPPVRSIED